MCKVRVAQCVYIAQSGSESQTSIERAPIFVLGCAAPSVPGVLGVYKPYIDIYVSCYISSSVYFGDCSLVFGVCAFPPVSLGPAGECPCTGEGSRESLVFGGFAFLPVSLGPAGDCPCRH